MLRLILIAVAALLIGGCVASSSRPHAGDALPPLRLSPAALGRSVAWQQKLEFVFDGKRETVEALLEVDPEEVRLLLHTAGQSALRLRWDGRELEHSRAEWLPAALNAERVLDDMQLVYWPLASVQAALPSDWRIDESHGVRRLHHGAVEVLRIEYPTPASARLIQHRYGYRLDVQSIEVVR